MSKKGNILSLVLTFLVVALYLAPNFVQAVAVSVSTDKDTYLPTDDTIETDLSVTIREDERIPINDIKLLLDGKEICRFDVDGTLIAGCAGISIIQTSAGDYGEGTLEGTDEATDEFTSFGYGIDQTLNGYRGTFSYDITADKERLQGDNSLGEGTHTFQLSVNSLGTLDSHVYSEETSFYLELGEVFEQSLTIDWNTVTLTVHPYDTAVASVLSSIEGKYDNVWVEVDGVWLSYSPTVLPLMNTLKDLDETTTFYIEMNQAATLTVVGSSLS